MQYKIKMVYIYGVVNYQTGFSSSSVYNFEDERWIFVMTAPRGSLTSDKSLDIVAFKQIIK